MKPLLFSTQKYDYLRQEMLQTGAYEEGRITHKTFPDGEHYYRIENDLTHQAAVLIGGTISENDTLELYDLACGLVGYGVRELTLLVPFFGYSTMERAVKKGEVVTAKTRARLLSSIPQASYGNQIVMVDLHVTGLQHYFEGGIKAFHLYAKPLIIKAAKDLAGSNFVLASTDAGRAKWVESLANDMGVSAAFVYKRRSSGSDTQITGVNADVKNQKVVLYDDMIRTGGSLLNAAQAYKEAGASQIFVIATHGVLPQGSIEKIQNSGLIQKIILTNTHPKAVEIASDFVEVRSISTLLHDFIQSL
nr:ribose-phosphate diphosphokinase [Hugenholtzia roseola]